MTPDIYLLLLLCLKDVADFDGDGGIDLAVTHRGANGVGNTFSVFMGNGSGGFSEKTDWI